MGLPFLSFQAVLGSSLWPASTSNICLQIKQKLKQGARSLSACQAKDQQLGHIPPSSEKHKSGAGDIDPDDLSSWLQHIIRMPLQLT